MRKTDRRTLYTRQTIKDTLLLLLKKKPFAKVTVAQLCRTAEITRATFYLHYQDIYAVVDEILDEALDIQENTDIRNDLFSLLAAAKEASPTFPAEIEENYSLLPVCQRVSDVPKYRPLFLDESLSSYILKHIFRREKDKLIPILADYYQIDAELAENFYLFLVAGSFAFNQKHKWKKDAAWFRFQAKILEIMGKK